MKELRISELMDDYRDDEFFPEGGGVADPKAVAARVLGQVRTSAPATKRRRLSVRAALLAAALAVGCALMLAAALPAEIFSLASGTAATFQRVSENRAVVVMEGGQEPLELEDGRLWLTVDGGRTDITGRIDRDTPYVYDYTDPDTGGRNYLVVGGTPEDYGWIEFHQLSGGDYASAGRNWGAAYCTVNGTTYDFNSLTEEQRNQVDRQMEAGLLDPDAFEYVWKPWYLNAVEPLAELGFQMPY